MYLLFYLFVLCMFRDISQIESNQAQQSMDDFIEDLGISAMPDASPYTRYKYFFSYLIRFHIFYLILTHAICKGQTHNFIYFCDKIITKY